ncbi:ATP-dependent helicase [Stieleria varia]|uniref:DNA 3'-5' helicase n=1 Tax=Stieleria varia TaxID=2528005 RepID=A0A5C6A0B9_9BACT|nr:ATP-dependent helicase [Stieleria varia]TWT92741.1 ATP-dependent DNA helicase PcrA [Stieleria varia]
MELNEGQRKAAEFAGGHALVLAGAGTGKTSTIVARVAHLVQSGADARRLLLLTFTRRAAREMKYRLKSQIGAAADAIAAGTFHNFCLSYLRRWPDLFQCPELTIIDRDDQLQLMKLARATTIGTDAAFPKPADLVNYSSYARNTNRGIKTYLVEFTDLDPDTVAQVQAVLNNYTDRKRECRYLDYDDILHFFARRLHGDAVVRQKLQSRYDHLLVDEMQDTNPLQWLILDGLRDPAKLFCVGDDAQSIYAFRGADFQNVHSFAERVPDSTTLKLNENYRSTQEILDLSNWLLNQSPLKYDKELRSARGPGIKPVLLEVDDDLEEADWVATDLMDRHNGNTPWRDHMILTRTAYASRSVEAALIENDIPYRFVGGTTLLASAHVKDLLSMLRVIDNVTDQLAWMRFLMLWPRIGEKTAAKAIDGILQLTNIADAVKLLRKRLADKQEMIAAIESVIETWQKPREAIETASKVLGKILEKRYDDWDRRLKDFALLQRLASKHESVRSFIETYTLDPITESEAQRQDADDLVTLITVHSAKGTEAPVCYLIGVAPGNYPHARSIGDDAQEEEERRVLYVAMTRAKDELIMTGTMRSHGAFVPHQNRRWTSSGSSQPYFLSNLPDHLVTTDTQMLSDDFDDEIISFRDR